MKKRGRNHTRKRDGTYNDQTKKKKADESRKMKE
jgi:hypothetical protein